MAKAADWTFTKLDDMLEQLDPLRRGKLPDRFLFAGQDQSRVDATRAPPGKGVLFLQALVPNHLPGGAEQWDIINEQVAERMLAQGSRFISNPTSANTLGKCIQTPLHHEWHSPNSFVGGDVHGMGGYFSQNAGMRPSPELAQYRVPGCERLYLVGPFMHPGGSVFGAGRNTVINVFEDLGLDFDKVSAAPASRLPAVNERPIAIAGCNPAAVICLSEQRRRRCLRWCRQLATPQQFFFPRLWMGRNGQTQPVTIPRCNRENTGYYDKYQ